MGFNGRVTRRIVVIGGGIVGAAMAASVAESGRLDVTVLERGPHDQLLGRPAVTADNLPLVGPVEEIAGLWMAGGCVT